MPDNDPGLGPSEPIVANFSVVHPHAWVALILRHAIALGLGLGGSLWALLVMEWSVCSSDPICHVSDAVTWT